MTEKKVDESLFLIPRTILTGFIGGLLTSLLGIMMYYFNFSEIIHTSYVLRSWITMEWTEGWIGNIVSSFIIGALSIFVALLYYVLFKKINSMWVGVAYGIILWCVFFFFIHPLFPIMKQIINYDVNTILSTVCLFVLYGLFIGYSIAYDYYDTYVLGKHEKVTK